MVADAAGLVGQRPGGFDRDLHVGDHLGHRRQPLDRPAELVPRVGIGAGQPIGRLGDPQRLGGNAHAGTVHQGQHVGDQAPLALADQPGRGVFEHQLAGRRAVDSQLLLQMAHPNLLRPLHQEQAQAAPVTDLRLASRQDQQDLAAAVGDKPLHPVEPPVTAGVLLRPQPNRL